MLKKLILSLLVLLPLVTLSRWDTAPFLEKSQRIEHDNGALSEEKYSVSLGMHYDEVLSRFGDPYDILPSEYGFSWNIFHENFQNYMQVGIADNRVVGIYTNSPSFSFRGITVGTSKADVNMILETPIKYIIKGHTKYVMNGLNDERVHMELFLADNMYVTVFYDAFKNNSVTAINIIEYETEHGFDRLYGPGSAALAESFEKQNFYVTNALRVREGLPALRFHEKTADVARLHSADMAEQNYFSHTDLSGGSVKDRAEDAGVVFYSIGENIAMGAQNSLYMHELLMNSEGHRNNILADFRAVGIGVAFHENNVPYLTQNFIG